MVIVLLEVGQSFGTLLHLQVGFAVEVFGFDEAALLVGGFENHDVGRKVVPLLDPDDVPDEEVFPFFLCDAKLGKY